MDILRELPLIQDPRLIVGYGKADDAAVYQVREDLCVVQTLDFFPPIVDDPYSYGAIAAANALSDLYAMGGEPKLCMNIFAVPKMFPPDLAKEILRGGYDKAYEAGAIVVGGHSIYDDEPKYGMAVTGFMHPDQVRSNADLEEGDILFYTKPLGAGMVNTGLKAELAEEATIRAAEASMMTLNKYARDVMIHYRTHAVTDITGFGILGHLRELAEGSDKSIILDPARFVLLPQALEFARLGLIAEGAYHNRDATSAVVDAGDTVQAMEDLLYDPQTSGGLMISVHPEDADALEKALREKEGVVSVSRVGRVVAHEVGGKRIFLRTEA